MLETPENSIPRSGKAMEIGQSAGKSYAYLLGVFLGDGCITRQGGKLVFKLNTIDEDFVIAVQKAIMDCYGVNAKYYTHEVKKSSRPNHSLWCANAEMCNDLLRDTGSEYKSSFPKFENIENEKSFIIGLMDSEGFIAKMTRKHTGRSYYMGYKSCDIWVPELVSLMQSVGLKIGKVSKCPPYRAHYKIPTRFHIKIQSWIDSGMRFNIARKQLRIDEWAATEPYSQRSRFPRKLTSETARWGAICA